MTTVKEMTAVERRAVGPQSVLFAGPVGASTVVLLHGIGSSGASFETQLKVLGRRRRVLAPDAPGYAHSADPDRDPGLDGYADAVVALLDAEGIDRSAVIGLSWGGVIATRLALRHPARVSALVLADTSRGAGVNRHRAEAMLRRPDELARDGAAAFARRRAPQLLSAGATSDAVLAIAAAMAGSIRLPGYAYAAASMAATDHSDDLGRISVPTLVIVGAEDVVCPPDEARAIAAGVRGARLEVISGAGHLAHQECPEKFNALVEGFLDEFDHAASDAADGPQGPREDAMLTDLDALLDSNLATRESREEDWDTLGFQAQAGDEFRRAQIRYIGSGATGDHESDSRVVAAEHFTFSNMLLPTGAVGPEHTHHDAEEVFFVLEGEVEFTIHDVDDGTRTASRVLRYRDLLKVPAGVPRSLRNVGDTDALFCVVIGAPKPELPTYPETSAMAGVSRG